MTPFLKVTGIIHIECKQVKYVFSNFSQLTLVLYYQVERNQDLNYIVVL